MNDGLFNFFHAQNAGPIKCRPGPKPLLPLTLSDVMFRPIKGKRVNVAYCLKLIY